MFGRRLRFAAAGPLTGSTLRADHVHRCRCSTREGKDVKNEDAMKGAAVVSEGSCMMGFEVCLKVKNKRHEHLSILGGFKVV